MLSQSALPTGWYRPLTTIAWPSFASAHPDHESRSPRRCDGKEVLWPVEEVPADEPGAHLVLRQGAGGRPVLVVRPPCPLGPGSCGIAGEVDGWARRAERHGRQLLCGRSVREHVVPQCYELGGVERAEVTGHLKEQPIRGRAFREVQVAIVGDDRSLAEAVNCHERVDVLGGGVERDVRHDLERKKRILSHQPLAVRERRSGRPDRPAELLEDLRPREQLARDAWRLAAPSEPSSMRFGRSGRGRERRRETVVLAAEEVGAAEEGSPVGANFEHEAAVAWQRPLLLVGLGAAIQATVNAAPASAMATTTPSARLTSVRRCSASERCRESGESPA